MTEGLSQGIAVSAGLLYAASTLLADEKGPIETVTKHFLAFSVQPQVRKCLKVMNELNMQEYSLTLKTICFAHGYNGACSSCITSVSR
jgi:hypothetical protein